MLFRNRPGESVTLTGTVKVIEIVVDQVKRGKDDRWGGQQCHA